MPIFTPQKASLKLGIWRERFGVRRKLVYEIHPKSLPVLLHYIEWLFHTRPYLTRGVFVTQILWLILICFLLPKLSR